MLTKVSPEVLLVVLLVCQDELLLLIVVGHVIGSLVHSSACFIAEQKVDHYQVLGQQSSEDGRLLVLS